MKHICCCQSICCCLQRQSDSSNYIIFPILNVNRMLELLFKFELVASSGLYLTGFQFISGFVYNFGGYLYYYSVCLKLFPAIFIISLNILNIFLNILKLVNIKKKNIFANIIGFLFLIVRQLGVSLFYKTKLTL